MLPQYQRLDQKPLVPLFVIPFGNFAVTTVSLPLFSFVFCVIWSILFFFERSTSTHCHVYNFLPSISAAIGNYQPQRFIWQSAIILHEVPRFVVAFIYYEYYNRVIRKNRRRIAYLAILLNVIECLALLALSVWTSVDNYDIHKMSFGIFIATSEVYMVITYFLNKNCRRKSLTKIETKSVNFKRNLFLTNVFAFGMAGYCFMRHNGHCEPGVYSMFSFFEYIVVFTNMGYHMTAYWDFSDRNLCFDWTKGLYFTTVLY